eukprot:5283198-Alexandrium_andersonii.AAC.1
MACLSARGWPAFASAAVCDCRSAATTQQRGAVGKAFRAPCFLPLPADSARALLQNRFVVRFGKDAALIICR